MEAIEKAAPGEFTVPIPAPTASTVTTPAISSVTAPTISPPKLPCVTPRAVAAERQIEDIKAQLEKLNLQTEVGKALLSELEALLKGSGTKLKRKESSGAIAQSLKQKRNDVDGHTSSAKSKRLPDSTIHPSRIILGGFLPELDHTFPEIPTVPSLLPCAGINRNVRPAQYSKFQRGVGDMPPEIRSNSLFSQLLRLMRGGDNSERNMEQIGGQINDENTSTESGYAVEVRKFVIRSFGRRMTGIEEDTGIETPRGGWRRAMGPGDAEGPHSSWKRTSGAGGDHEAKRETFFSANQPIRKRYVDKTTESAKSKRQDPSSRCPTLVAKLNTLGISVDANICLGGNGVADDKLVTRALGGNNILGRQTLVKRPIIRNGNPTVRTVGDEGSVKS